MIFTQQIVKKFGDFTAVNGVNLEIRRGECFGLLGPNGAGKSTLISMTYGVILRTSGDLKVFGLDPAVDGRSIKKRLGVVTQDNALDESLTVKENMLIYASFLGVPKYEREPRVDNLLAYMNLAHKSDARIQMLSGGMKRRLVFVRALLGKPEIIILDEPTTGLDPAVRHLLWGKIKELREQGVTILLTTHYMHEAEILCDRVAVMNRGQILAIASPQEMIAEHTPGFVAVYEKNESIAAQLKTLAATKNLVLSQDNSGVYVRAPHFEDLLRLQKDCGVTALQLRPANLEDVFLKLTVQELSTND